MATYTKEQMARYFDHIDLPQHLRASPLSLSFLNELMKRQLAVVPFENLSLHYSKSHCLSLEPNDLFEKIVGRSRGGYCMENNAFFGTVLRSLGFKIMSSGARVNVPSEEHPEGAYGGWSHMVNYVTIDGNKYLVDVGYGGDGPCRPILVHSGKEVLGVSPQMLKLEYKSIPNFTDPSQRIWVYSHKAQPNKEWRDAYAFTEIEFLPEDYAVMNLSTMTLPGFFTENVICVKFILSENRNEVEGTVILFKDEVKKKIQGEIVETEKFENEEQRLAALEKWFGIRFTEEEKQGIKNMVSELK